MSDGTNIEWTDATWNPTTGCTKISPGCANCYIVRTPAFRIHGRTFVKGATDLQLHADRLEQPLHWRKPRRVFVNSLSDLFHVDVPDSFIAEVFGVMAVCGARTKDGPDVGDFGGRYSTERLWYDRKGPHTFQVLTKRPERMLRLLTSPKFRQAIADAAYRRAHNQRDAGYLAHQIGAREEYGRCYEPGGMWPLSNVWLGVSVENQHFADERIPLLLQTPAAVRFISAEPLLGPVDLDRYVFPSPHRFGTAPHLMTDELRCLDWVIIGVEKLAGDNPGRNRNGYESHARPLLRQCAAAGVAAFHKQMPVLNRTVPKGRVSGDPAEWPADLRVREFPAGPA